MPPYPPTPLPYLVVVAARVRAPLWSSVVLPRARSCPLRWRRPALKGFVLLFLVFWLCSSRAVVCWYYVYL
jgi:hypothetical protein